AGYGVHPALLDAAFHSMLFSLEGDDLYLPFAMDSMVVQELGVTELRAHIRVFESEQIDVRAMDVRLLDAHGECVAAIEGLRGRRVNAAALFAQRDVLDAFYQIEWREVGVSTRAPLPKGRYAIVARAGDLLALALAEQLRAAGASSIVVQPNELAA